MSVTSIRLQPDVEAQLQAISVQANRSKNWLINQAIKEYVDRQTAEQIRWKETLEAIESVAQGRTVDADNVHAWLKTWGTQEELPPPRVTK